MIRVTTDRALSERLARHRRTVAAQLADAVEASLPPACDHRDRPSCPKCSARRTVLASARIVRESGGVF